MELQRDLDRPEIMDEMSEDFEERGKRPKRRFRGENGFDPQKKSLIFGAVGAVVLIILLVVFFGGKEKNPPKELEAFKAGLDGLEKRVARIEGMEQKLSGIEGQIKALNASLQKLERQTGSLREHMDKVERMAQAASTPKPPPQTAAPQKKPSAQGDKRLYEVKRGETLFSIAKKFGMSGEELRRLNNLSKNDTIQPGQKLIVPSGN